MEAEVAALVGGGATALVELMLTDAWSQAKRIGLRLLGAGSSDDQDQLVDDELEQARQEVAEARSSNNDEREAELVAEWTSRMRRAAARDAEAAVHLRELIQLYQSTDSSQSTQTNHFGVVARDSSRIYQQGSGTQNNY